MGGGGHSGPFNVLPKKKKSAGNKASIKLGVAGDTDSWSTRVKSPIT